MTVTSPSEMRVLVLAPVGRDFQLADAVFLRHGVAAAACASLADLCRQLEVGAGAVLLIEEALSESDGLLRWVAAQPTWSDMPILLLARPRVDLSELAETVERYGNVTILERPARVAALVSAVRSALRARSRQYQMREHLALRTAAEEDLRDNDRRKDEFLAILAHELRNPLAPISNGLQILKLSRNNARVTAATAEMMERQVANMKRLVDELLEVSRVTRGELDLRRERVELSAVIRSAMETSRPLIDARRHRLDWLLPPDPIYLHADPVRLGQAISNILNNAAKYTEPGGSITLSVDTADEQVGIHVIDSGIGIPPEAQSRIFDLFVQLKQNRSRSGGLGIGLTLAQRLVELHGGSIEVYSQGRGFGSRFTVRLPMLQDAAEPSSPTAELQTLDLSGLRVLVADDNCDAADSLSLFLERLGARVSVAYGGASALACLQSARADAAVIDVGMPDVDGLEVARRIRQQPSLADMLLIALTGWGQAKDLEATRNAGFDHHLTKPPDVEVLVSCLQRARGRQREQLAQVGAGVGREE